MLSYLILMFGFIFMLIGRYLYRRWFNHITLYAGIWCISLFLYNFGLIHYYPLEVETWIMILGGGISFFLGSLTHLAARYSIGLSTKSINIQYIDENALLNRQQSFILRALWVLNIISLCIALQHWYVVLSMFGSVANVLILGNTLYSFRVSQGIPGTIPYFDSFALSASLFAGVYTKMVGKIKLVAILPMVIVILVAIANMGRAKMLIAAILFLSGYVFTKRERGIALSKSTSSKVKGAIALTLAIALMVFGFEVVRKTRAGIEAVPYTSRALQNLRASTVITPSVYLYLTIHHGVFNQYLKKDIEKTPWGSNTLGPLYKPLIKLGFDIKVADYQKFYNTPPGSNTGTYLRELHADFGILGVLFFPYGLGLIASIFFVRYQMYRRFIDLALLSHLLVIVVFSFILVATRWGYWQISLIGSLIVAWGLDRMGNSHSVAKWIQNP